VTNSVDAAVAVGGTTASPGGTEVAGGTAASTGGNQATGGTTAIAGGSKAAGGSTTGMGGTTATGGTTVSSGAGKATHGITIPSTHPRLWFDTARLAQARVWYAANPFTPSGNMWNGEGLADNALRGLLANEPTQCQTAINWASSAASTLPIPMSGTACDQCRWFGEEIILIYDWCYAQMSPSLRTSLVSATNAWIDHWRTQAWGGVPMHQNNYYWGNVRNELEWAITSYEDNVTEAEVLLTDALDVRLGADFYPAASADSRGGIGQEGSEYGPYIANYASIPFVTAGLYGRDLLRESSYWREAVYALLYATTPSASYQEWTGTSGFTFFPFSDDENWNSSALATDASVGNFMTVAAMEWNGTATGSYARQWLKMTGADRDLFVPAVDTGGTAAAFDTLPLDYYASGPRYFYGRNAWGASATAFFLQLGDIDNSILGHVHTDWGTWQLWRKGRWLSRETVGYSDKIVGYANQGSVDVIDAVAHNSILVNGQGPSTDPYSDGKAGVVTRLESRSGYAYAVVDLTGGNNAAVAHMERELLFVRGLETLVILDRIQSTQANAVKTFLVHCETNPQLEDATHVSCINGTQALHMTTLVPSSPTVRVVTEGTTQVGQYRIEVDTSPGTTTSYIVTVLDASDTGSARLSPSIVEATTSYTVGLNPTTSITFQKGVVSSGGTITLANATTTLRSDVQPMVVTDDGPAWQ
jgi:hypothetical protein